MWFGDDLVEILRGGAVLVAFLVVVSPVNVGGASEFTVHRLQQYQLNSNSYGSLGSLVAVEAGSFSSHGSMLRQCILVRLADLTPSVYNKISDSGAAAMVVILPGNMTAMSAPARQLVREMETAMLNKEVSMAVYFAQDNAELSSIYKAVSSHTKATAKSAAATFLSSIASDGYQMVVSGAQSKPIHDIAVANIQGKLMGYSAGEKLPTVALVAHYDTFAAAPELAVGADSNGSGVAALLEAARLMSRLFRAQYTHPRTNMLFVLPSGGYLNYHGSKRFVEDQLDSTENSLLSDSHPRFVLCLDSLTATDALYLHVSKPPKSGTLMHSFYVSLQEAAKEDGVSLTLVHRKINLQDVDHPWEHHKYSIRRLPAATLSALPHPDGHERGSIVDTQASLDIDRLVRHSTIINKALVRHIYSSTSDQEETDEQSLLSQMPDSLSVTPSTIGSWLSMLTTQARSPQLLMPANKHPLVKHLQEVLERYTNDVKVNVYSPDKRDPEFGFHDMTGGTMTAYSIKPVSFDFLLSFVIAGYMGLLYLALQQLPLLHKMLIAASPPITNGKIKHKAY